MSNYYLARNGQRTGPYSSAQLRQLAAEGLVAPTDMIWKEGWTRWAAVSEVKGIFPNTGRPLDIPLAVPVASGPTPVLPPTPHVSSPLSAGVSLPSMPVDQPQDNPGSMVGILALGVACVLLMAFLGWLVHGWLRPLTPREVCERFEEARTAQEAKRYCTLNMHRAIDEVFRNPNPGTDDPFEFTQESDAPSSVGGYFVGFRGHIYDADLRRRVQIDGVFHLIKSDAWRIEDIYLLSADRQPLPEPASLASLLDQVANAREGRPAAFQAHAGANARTAKQWYSDPRVQTTASRVGLRWLALGGGGKWLAGIGIAIFAVLAGWWQKVSGQGGHQAST